jgi:hypothetical protein
MVFGFTGTTKMAVRMTAVIRGILSISVVLFSQDPFGGGRPDQ